MTAHPPIVVLFGGPSAEHDVSVVSGTAIADALRDTGDDVREVLIDLEGGWWWLPASHRRDGRSPASYDDPAALGGEGPIRAGAALDRLAAADGTSPTPLVFIALHGPFGEDGTVQALLESAGIAYTGAGVTASAIGMDKAIFKRLARGIGLPVADWLELRADRWGADRAAALAAADAFRTGDTDGRVIVKPSRLGSSVGISLVRDGGGLAPALEEAFRYGEVALVERYVAAARELEVSVIGNDPARLELFGPGEILSGHEFYDFAAKYTPGLSETSTRAEIPESLRQTILKIARDAYRAIGAEGFARVDFLLDGERPILSEINTIPGFTPISLFPTLPAAGGYTFGDVCRKVVDLALERQAGRGRRQLTASDLPR